jgi:hypothetical protein
MDNRAISAQVKNFLTDLLASINNLFHSVNWPEVLFCLKIGLFILSVLMVVAIAFVLILKTCNK